ncbi:heat shock 70 kDa protein 12A-like [Mercenaria mercenaria]|uniref:heat shock 70 kDa protein 12A-like n=1 Tax=Mercenaria mercenaria TaxID=6596 RepID=UPI00234EEF81|nr:heat shock 70 kDa protein 12A-like [Mercenaria mercenaria]
MVIKPLRMPEAGIDDNMLSIALELEAASLFCRHLSVDSTADQKCLSVSQFSPGTRYLVLDAGGGTIDTTVHEVEADRRVKEIHAATGGGWGGIMVDKEFEMLNRCCEPLGASSTILKGALVYGHNPKSVSERILRCTYGVKTTNAFESGKHPESKRKAYDIGDRCEDIFKVHVEKNQVVCVGEAQMRNSYFPLNRGQTYIEFPIYASEGKSPKYTDESGCIHLGNVKIDIPRSSADPTSRKVWVSMTFSGTEIIINAEDEESGKKVKACLNFLG